MKSVFPLSKRLLASWSEAKRPAATLRDGNTLFLYDQIGQDFWWDEGVSAKQFLAELDAIKTGEVAVRINSPGGFVDDGVAIYNALMRKSKGGQRVTVHIDALAASVASIIAMAGDEIRIAGNAQIMVHNPWTFAAGNASDLRVVADSLDKTATVLRDTYAARSRQDAALVASWMDAETWFTAAEALAFKLVDHVEPLKGAEESQADADRALLARARSWATMSFLQEP